MAFLLKKAAMGDAPGRFFYEMERSKLITYLM
jgi:hypothetical protein